MSTAPARSVEERLEELEAEHEILRTIHAYSHALAYGEQEEEFLDCFTEDAVCEPRPRNSSSRPTVGRAEGRAQLTQFYRNHAHARSKTSPESWFKHVTGDTRIKRSGNAAVVESHYVTPIEIKYEDGTTEFEVLGMGRYKDQFVKCPDGRWRIKERWIEIEAGVRRQWQGTVFMPQKRP